MQLNKTEFTYEKYKLAQEPEVINMSLIQLAKINPAFRRYVVPLGMIDVHTTQEMVKAFTECRLKDVRGPGKKFFGLTREFISNQKYYSDTLDSLNGGKNEGNEE